MLSPRSNGEREALLGDEEDNYHHDDVPCPPNPYRDLPVYTTIHRVRREVINSIEDSYSLDQLRAPRINVAVVRPLVNRLWEQQDESLVYCLLVNKLQFQREQAFQAHQTINTTRAMLCELVALKILRRFDEDNPGREGLLLLSHILVAGFEPFQKAPEEVVRKSGHATHWTFQQAGGYERKSTTLEVGIISESKMLLSSPASQKVMEAVYKGRIIYTPSSWIDIIPDHYKHKPIALYHPSKGPLLNQYRLMVPRTRNIMDIYQFMILLVLYILTMHFRHYAQLTIYEIIFGIYAFGWVLDEFASILEHGWHCYTQNLWSFLDFIFAMIYMVYLVLRLHNLTTGDDRSGEPALDILSAGAPVLIPRLAFNLLSENMLFVSLRAMMKDFLVLTALAVWCFAGFLLSMVWLGDGEKQPITVGKWMLFVWFGLDGTGVQKSVEMHWLIGPILMVTFAFLGNTLFLTILVSMLSSTFSKIANNATSEIQFRRAVLTFEGVKSDAIFAYQPPFNILALFILLPMKFVLSPRWFHKINVAAVKTINAPLLIIISIYERRYLWARPKRNQPSVWALWDFSRFSVHGDTQAVFAVKPPQSVLDEIADTEHPDNKDDHPGSSDDHTPENGNKPVLKPPLNRSNTGSLKSKRKGSMTSMTGIGEHLSEYLHEHGAADIGSRLEVLEKGMGRIEGLLGKLCGDLIEDEDDEVGSKVARKTTKEEENDEIEQEGEGAEEEIS